MFSKCRQAGAIPDALEHCFSHLLTYNIHVYDLIGIPLHNTIEFDVLMLTEGVTKIYTVSLFWKQFEKIAKKSWIFCLTENIPIFFK